jgi:enoyl-[acyl-carrier-protein] reductase (NADH)
VFAALKQWGCIDFVVHAVAFSDAGTEAATSIPAARTSTAPSPSPLSFTAVAARGALMQNGGLLTLTYLGASRVTQLRLMGVARAGSKPPFAISPPISAGTASASMRSAPVRCARWRAR